MAVIRSLCLGLVAAFAFASAAFAQEQAETPAKSRIVVIGDSLGEGLAPALVEALEDVETLDVQRRARGSTGFVREDFYDWRKASRDIVAEGPVAAVVIMIGVNDRQAMQIATGRVPALGDEWRKEYIVRVDDVLNTFKTAKARIYWVGLPPMPPSRVSSDMAALNEIFRERVAAAEGKFIDIWDAFANDDGRFTPVGPDLTGSIRRLRASDGVHFSRAGYEKLAHFVEREVRVDLAPGTGGEEVATPEETPPPVEEPPPAAALAPAPAEVAPSGETEVKDKKPSPGPVVPLTGAKSGEETLVGGTRKTSDVQAVVPPKPGRADDFHWPRTP